MLLILRKLKVKGINVVWDSTLPKCGVSASLTIGESLVRPFFFLLNINI